MTHSHASRPFSTDGMVEAVCARHPRTAIDLGCGEGWLVRALASQHIDVLGIDAVQALLRAIPGLPVPDGALIVQTLHRWPAPIRRTTTVGARAHGTVAAMDSGRLRPGISEPWVAGSPALLAQACNWCS